MIEKRQASSFYQHFDYQERPVVDYYTGLFNRFLFQRQPILTDFLNPRERYIFKTIVGNEAQLLADGGYPQAEKRRMLLCDWDYQFGRDDFQITLLQVDYNKKWDQINHSQILGVLTHLGVETNTFGDIISDEAQTWQFFVKSDLVDFFIDEVQRVGRSKVKLTKISPRQIIEVADDSREITSTSISLRLDAVVASVTNLSRSQVKDSLLAGNIKLNWHDCSESNIIISVNDIISVRHFGRIQLIGITTTKKGKYRLDLKIWQAKKR